MSLYVSPSGSDGNPGSAAAPLRTLAKAVSLARASSDKDILLFGGDYDGTHVVLDARDRGLSIGRAAEDEPCLRGGVALRGWEPVDGLWRVALPPECTGDIRLLELDGRSVPRARLPGFLRHRSVFSSNWMSTSAGGWDVKPTRAQLTELVYDPAGLPDGFQWDGVELTVLHKWDETLTGVAAHDPQGHRLTLSVECTHPPGGFGADRYIVWNTACGMAPGRWRHDRAARAIWYRALAGEDMRHAVAYIPLHDTIIQIHGGVEGLTMRDIALHTTSSPAVPGGFGAAGIPGAIDCAGSLTDCAFDNLSIQNVSGWGLRLSGENERVLVRGCQLADTGAGGILLGTGTDCAISGNRIERAGRIYPSAIGIMARGCAVVGNILSDLPYTGICYSGDGGEIAGNRVSDAVNVLNDGAGIYATFGQSGVLRGNTVENIPQSGEPDSTRNGLYLDEQCRGWVVEGNRTLDCSSAMMNHMSRGNALRGNLFAAREGDLLFSMLRCADYRLTENTLHSGGTVTLAGNRHAVASFERNLLYSGEGRLEQIYVSDDYSRSAPVRLDANLPLT